jgi:hypothetical protein
MRTEARCPLCGSAASQARTRRAAPAGPFQAASGCTSARCATSVTSRRRSTLTQPGVKGGVRGEHRRVPRRGRKGVCDHFPCQGPRRQHERACASGGRRSSPALYLLGNFPNRLRAMPTVFAPATGGAGRRSSRPPRSRRPRIGHRAEEPSRGRSKRPNPSPVAGSQRQRRSSQPPSC